ncbi:hypothetical protein INS49_004504 [Diaporthe citri]|uniref:uncharacterized protein n=1 Tax=Diaporthe citri TaxID=83186 RepID=UPI001C818906|nr:uncharacterized protein INS49_004504 [Diaporthe citri]KAG6354487.1 hypothetical protein INS49_004504 [Diaporthe citri]
MGVLPKTILDTFTIAHRLDLKYIWIDRLCILQDSREDWSREASRMALIYKYAFLTISASCAAHENQGCFRKRNVAGIQPLQLISNPLLPSVAWCHGNASCISSGEPEENQKLGGKLGHLADRGWVFQERILSHRIVHFAEEEVYWECRELEASEAWPDGDPLKSPRRPPLLYDSGNEHRVKYSAWHKVVQDYSARVFTHDGDKLPALSGLARETAELRKDVSEEYLAGLWRSTALIDLCWRHFPGRLRVPEQYLAPSWSWASLSGNIDYGMGGQGVRYRPAATFKDARFRFATADPYGAVLDGWIHLFGHLKPVTVVQSGLPDHVRRKMPWEVRVHGTNGQCLPFDDGFLGTLDIETFAPGEKESVAMFCLPVLKNQQLDPEEYCPDFHCLLLVENGSIKHRTSSVALPSPKVWHEEEYQRAGLATITVSNWVAFQEWLDESPQRDVIIR